MATPPIRPSNDASERTLRGEAQPELAETVARLEQRLGHAFGDPTLCVEALTHRSYANVASQRGELVADNQRLEFLGDAVLDLIVGERLFRIDPGADPGTLTQRRIALVTERRLARLGSDLGLGEALRLGPGEERSRIAKLPSVLADTFEAVLGAVYLDAGLAAAAAVVERVLGAELVSRPNVETLKSPKVQLQELAQGRWALTPSYSLIRTTPDFEVEVRVGQRFHARGRGATRRAAEEAAAEAAQQLAHESMKER